MKSLFSIKPDAHGRGPIMTQWQPGHNFLASAGSNGLVHIWDRQGTHFEEVALNSQMPITGLEWDKDGELLAIMQQNNPCIMLWNFTTRQTSQLTTNIKDPTFIKWSKVGPQLAIGTAKGNLIIYRKDNRKTMSMMGKHSKRIVCGDWSSTNQLALGSVDMVFTLSNEAGETIEQRDLEGEPLHMMFAIQKTEETKDRIDNTLCINVGGKTIMLYSFAHPEKPIKLQFQARYGDIISYDWFGDGYMLVGFSQGFAVCISTHMKEINEELLSYKFLTTPVEACACCSVLNRAAVAGGDSIKLIDMREWREMRSDVTTIDSKYGGIVDMNWSDDGQIITVTTSEGAIFNFLGRMPAVHDSCGSMVAHLSSLQEVAIVDSLGHQEPRSVPISMEPNFLALGPQHLAVAMNNRVSYYSLNGESGTLITEREYNGTVSQIKVNNGIAAALTGGQVHVHHIQTGPEGDNTLILPAPDVTVNHIDMAGDYLIMGSEEGKIEYFNLVDWTMSSGCELQHPKPIISFYPNSTGTRVVFIDSDKEGFMYNPVQAVVIPVEGFDPATQSIIWDNMDPLVFVACTEDAFVVFTHASLTINGHQVISIGSLEIRESGDMVLNAAHTHRPRGWMPVVLNDGIMVCQEQNGSLQTLILSTHDMIHRKGRLSQEQSKTLFAQFLSLLRLKEAFDLARQLQFRSHWLALSGKAMEQLDMTTAIRVYRELGDAAMVMALEGLEMLEDKSLLAGHVAMLFGDYNLAQELFVSSSEPTVALEMRRDLFNWEHALKLAQSLAPEQVALLSVEYAQQLEFRQDFSGALSMYEAGQRSDDVTGDMNVQRMARAGIARMSMRTGDLRRGLQIALESSDQALCRECGSLLEELKQYPDAALLYERGGEYDKAAHIFIQSKNFTAAAPLMSKIKSTKLHTQFAKAREAGGDPKGAYIAYERASDLENMCRILIRKLHDPEKAFEIVRESRKAPPARLAADFCVQAGDFTSAIEFMLIAKELDKAFELAKKHDEMDVFADHIGELGSASVFTRIAKYHESKGRWSIAGDFYSKCQQYQKALKLYLQCGESHVSKAIDVVGLARSDQLTHILIDFLMGDPDGVPKDPKHIFRLYMALESYPQAAKTAIILARQEQENGRFKKAHNFLLETMTELRAHDCIIPRHLHDALMLIHSHQRIKALAATGNHFGAAQMLLRVIKKKSQFPSQLVNLLTSTVIECQRSGLKKSAYETALSLMTPEHRELIPEKFKRKIEGLIRRPSKDEKVDDCTPCPNCASSLSNHELECDMCLSSLPYCIVTGRHMTRDDWCQCKNCGFPALSSAMNELKQSSPTAVCPMCETLLANNIEEISDPSEYLKNFRRSADEDGEIDDKKKKNKK